MRTHYDNLQVSRSASDIVIRASYRALLQKYHPDKFEDRVRGERISRILNEAYAVLSDPVRRAEYDATLEEDTPEPVSAPASPPPEPPQQERQSPAPSVTPSKQQGMRWATWCIYISYPLGALIGISTGVGAISNQNVVGGLIALTSGLLNLWTAILLQRRELRGWKLNWLVLGLSGFWIVLGQIPKQVRENQQDWWIFILIDTALVALVWIWPSIVYWRKRRHLFSEHSIEKFQPQWSGAMALPVGIIVVAILAAIALPAYQDYVKRQQGALATQLQSPQTAPDPGRDSLTKKTQQAVGSQRQQQEQWFATSLQARANQWYAIYPFLNPESPIENDSAINAVIARRDQLITNGTDPGDALDMAVKEVAPRYASTFSAIHIADVSIGKALGANGHVAAPISTFGANDTIYAVILSSTDKPNTVMTARWTYQGSQLVKEDTQLLAGTGANITTLHIAKPDGWPTGNYALDLLVGGATVSRTSFSVQ